MDTKSLGRTVRWARRRAGLTQAELAQRLRMPQSTIARIEGGTVDPRAGTVIAILKATGSRLELAPTDPPVDAAAIRRALALDVPMRVARALGRVDRIPEKTPIRILRRLRRFSVPFVLVGELAEIAHGSPASAPRLIEVVHAQTDVAEERIGLALEELKATPAGRSSFKMEAGSLHLATASYAGDDYELLRRNAVRLPVSSGVPVSVAAIEDLVRARVARGTSEDLLAAAVLRNIVDTQN